MQNLFLQIISLENLYESWRTFRNGKRNKEDVQVFERNLADNLFELHNELKNKIYRHSNYTAFYITDPKQRHIHKAEVRDRIVHHALYRVLYPKFDNTFIYDTYSCRLDKGTHRAVKRLESFTKKVSRNYTKPCFALKCDVKKFFDSVDHKILMNVLENKITDQDTRHLINEIICSFNRSKSNQLSLFEDLNLRGKSRERERDDSLRLSGKGIPIGNLTSQLFANVYMNELDQFVKHKLKIKYYLRYCDDFIVLSDDERYLENLVIQIESFLISELKLRLHENKVSIRKLKQGIDFLGYIVFPCHIVLRTKTRRRMLRRIDKQNLSSYLGLLKHCNGYKLADLIKGIASW